MLTAAEAINGALPVSLGHAPIDPLQGQVGHAQRVLYHVQHDLELGEHQHLRKMQSQHNDSVADADRRA